MTCRLTTTHADGSQTVTEHADHGAAIEAARAALDLGATGAAIVRPEPRGYRARVMCLAAPGEPGVQVACCERLGWSRADAMTWAREEARNLRTSTLWHHRIWDYRPEVEVLR